MLLTPLSATLATAECWGVMADDEVTTRVHSSGYEHGNTGHGVVSPPAGAGRQFKMTYSDTLCKMTYSDTLDTGSSSLRHWKQRLYLLSSCAAGLADSIIIMRGLRVREG